MAKKKYDEEEGVWRTIGGRRVFIKKGQKLSDAMKESGKFKTGNRREVQEAEAEKRVKKLAEKNTELYKKNGGFADTGDVDRNKEVEKDHRKWLDNAKEANDLKQVYQWGEYDNPTENKGIISRKAGKHISKQDDYEYNLYKKAREDESSIDPMTEWSTDWEELDKKYKDRYDKEMNSKDELDWREQIKKNNEETDRITKELELKRNTGEYYMNYDKWSDDYYGAFRENERRNAKIKKEIPTEPYENVEAYAGYIDKLKKYEDKENVTGTPQHWMGTEYTNDEFMEHLTDANWHTERRMLEDAQLTNQELSYIKDRTKLGVWSADLDRDKTQKLIDEAKAKFRGKEDSITTKYKGTIDYLKETTDMSEAEIIELLRKRGKK